MKPERLLDIDGRSTCKREGLQWEVSLTTRKRFESAV